MAGSGLKPIRMLTAALLLVVGVAILAFLLTENSVANRDFICYWAAGRQLVHHADPYDGAAILELQRGAGFTENRPFFMRNPPTAFFLALPLGLMSEKTGAIVWSLVMVASLMLSIRMIWAMEGRPEGRLHLLGYLFPPVLICLLSGQLGILILLSFTTFLYLHETKPYLAGFALFVCSIKPHLFIPLGIVLLVWCVKQKAYRVLAGGGIATAASFILAYALDPSAWSHYFAMAKDANLKEELIPTVSLLFRLAIHRDAVWLQLVPAMLAAAWAVWYFRRSDWSWNNQGLLLLVVSVMVAPYAWVTDESVVLPAILHGAYMIVNNKRPLTPLACVFFPGLIETVIGVQPNTVGYLWTAPAWLAFYLYASRNSVRSG